MSHKALLILGVAACLAAPTVLAQGRGGGGGPPTGAGQSVHQATSPTQSMDHGSFGRDTSQRAQELRSADHETRTGFGAQQSIDARAEHGRDDRDPRTQDRRIDAKVKADTRVRGSNETQSTFGQDTAARAKLQQDADVDTRNSFGDEQSTAAKARAETRSNTRDDDKDRKRDDE
jgi:hypothetical protein